MRITAISDMHGLLPDPGEVPACDLLLIGGDICPVRDHSLPRQSRWLQETFRPWLNTLNAKEIVGIAGNHDFIAQKFPRQMQRLPWTYLEDEWVVFEGLKIYGTPWVPNFGPWAFMDDERALAHIFGQIPLDTDVLLSHGPAAGLGGMTDRGIDAGSVALREKIEDLTFLKLHVFGHIHEAFGDTDGGPHGAIYTNVSMVDLQYRPRPIATLRTFEL